MRFDEFTDEEELEMKELKKKKTEREKVKWPKKKGLQKQAKKLEQDKCGKNLMNLTLNLKKLSSIPKKKRRRCQQP